MLGLNESLDKIIESTTSQLSEERAEEFRRETERLDRELFEELRRHREEFNRNMNELSNIKPRETRRRRFF